jgi:tetratricopeptide (TPR) repeat protein
LNNLAALYQVQERYDDAEPLFLRALEIKEQALGKDHPDVAASLNNLAVLHYYQHRLNEALPLATRAVSIAEARLGADHPNTQIFKQTLRGIQAALAPTSPS